MKLGVIFFFLYRLPFWQTLGANNGISKTVVVEMLVYPGLKTSFVWFILQ